MGWGEKAIELRAVETGCLEGVFMHKKAQKLKFLCERNDKVHGAEVGRRWGEEGFIQALLQKRNLVFLLVLLEKRQDNFWLKNLLRTLIED